MNAAVIIGVSKYNTSGSDLPACEHDAKAINDILGLSDKYTEILYINNNQTSVKTKKSLTDFITNIRGQQVEELFFYYSGHGEFYNDDFYYQLSDFDSKKRNQTALQNSEADRLFRSLSPALIVKVIDACQSGTTYIKSNEVIESYLKKSATESFKNCYFIYSSLNTQASYSTAEISHFTASFINALKHHQGEGIRYKDIIDVIVDDFQNDTQQTPFFVIQGDFTEKFISFNKKLTEYFSDSAPNSPATTEADKSSSLIQFIKQDAKNYATKEGALNTLGIIQEKINSLHLKNELKEFYNISPTFLQEYLGIPYKGPVEKWLKDNPKEYFAKPIYVEGFDDEVGEYTSLEGFSLGMEVPFKEIVIDINGTYPNVPSYNCSVLYLLSKKSIRFFYCISRYVDLNFEDRRLDTKNTQWFTTECKIADQQAVIGKIAEIRQKIEDLIEVDLNSRFNPEVDDLPF